jgi:hypothetical protein
MYKEQSAVPDIKVGDLVANSESVVKGPTVQQSDTKGLTVKRSEGDDGNVEDSEGEGAELEDSELEGSDEGWEDEDSDIGSSDKEESSEMHNSHVGGHSIEDIDFANIEFNEIIAMLDEEGREQFIDSITATMSESEFERFIGDLPVSLDNGGEPISSHNSPDTHGQDAKSCDIAAGWVSGPQIEPEDDSGEGDYEYHAYGPFHITDVFAPIRPTAEPKAFTLFPKLPIEIRRMIWRATFRPRRHVWSYEDGAGPCCKRIGLTHPPIALFVNKESREEALQCYEKLNEGAKRCGGYARRTPYVFFNTKLDTLRIEKYPSTKDFCKDHFEKPYEEIVGQIQYLEMEEWAFTADMRQYHDFEHLSKGSLKDFKALKQLTFIPTMFPLWMKKDLEEENGRNVVSDYKVFFEKLAAEDLMRTMPKITIGKSSEGAKSMCEWLYEM